jgi:inner membrane transporter RhtA
MTTRAARNVAVPPWGLALAAMLSVQLGSALSVHLISTVGPAGTAWLRLSMGALIFLALARPPLRSVRPHDVPALVGLGVTTGLVTIAFLAAIERIPLGTAVAVEFLGPLTVAALRKMTPTAFGTLMALEPAIGVLLGLLVLHQEPSATQIGGIMLVVLAGTAAQRGGRRRPPATEGLSEPTRAAAKATSAGRCRTASPTSRGAG